MSRLNHPQRLDSPQVICWGSLELSCEKSFMSNCWLLLGLALSGPLTGSYNAIHHITPFHCQFNHPLISQTFNDLIRSFLLLRCVSKASPLSPFSYSARAGAASFFQCSCFQSEKTTFITVSSQPPHLLDLCGVFQQSRDLPFYPQSRDKKRGVVLVSTYFVFLALFLSRNIGLTSFRI